MIFNKTNTVIEQIKVLIKTSFYYQKMYDKKNNFLKLK